MKLRCVLATSRHILRVCLVIGLCFILLSGSIVALVPQNPNPRPAYLVEDAGYWLDAWLPDALVRYHVPGAAVALVRADQVLALKGYGSADLAASKPVDAEQTAFQAAAFSRLLVALAVLQLVDQGKLDLHADISRYLDGLPLPTSNSQPLTLAHLLTQSAGFAPRTIGTALRQADDILSLQTALAASRPAQTTTPGQSIAVSSYGMALAAASVEAAAGMPYADYVEASILQPLGMRYASTAQPLPRHVSATAAQGYNLRGERLLPMREGYPLLPAVDGLYLSAADSAALLLAVLGDGVLGSERIFNADKTPYLLQQQFQLAAGLPGVSLAFTELWLGQTRLLKLGSSGAGFSSAMLLWPADKFGLTLMYNSDNPELNDAFQAELLQRLGLDSPQPALQPSSLAPEYTAQLRGYYRLEPLAVGRERTRQLFRNEPSAELRVTTSKNGTFALKGGAAAWHEVTPGLFVDASVSNWLRIRQAVNGRVSGLYLNQATYQRIPWYRSLTWHRRFGIGLIAVLLLGFIPLMLYLRTRAVAIRPSVPPVAAEMMAAVSLLLLAAGLGAGLLFGGDLQYGVSSAVLILQTLVVAAVAVGIALLWRVIQLWRRRQGPLWFRIVGGVYLRMLVAVLSYIYLLRIF